MIHTSSLHILERTVSGRQRVLDVKDVYSRYGRIEVLHGISLQINRGEIVALIGSNGAGKTTLLRAISGVQPITKGNILYQSKSLGGVPAHARVKQGIAQVPEGRQIFLPAVGGR